MNIIISGGHSGLGLELSKKLLAEGHRLGMIIRIKKPMEETQATLAGDEGVEYFLADLSDHEQVRKVSDHISSSWDYVDVLFNNAGVLLDAEYYSNVSFG
jgi:short-subunit dehydrogenase